MGVRTRKKALLGTIVPAILATSLVGFLCIDRDGSEDTESIDKRHLSEHSEHPSPRVVRRHFRQLALALAKSTQGWLHVSGTVRDTEQGDPVPLPEVALMGALGGQWKVRGDDRGRYSLKVPPGVYRAIARADGYVNLGSTGLPRHPRPPDASDANVSMHELTPILEVSENRHGVDLELSRGATISGTVRDLYGDPVAGAVVAGRLFGYEGRSTRVVSGADTATSNAAGEFSIQVPAGSIEIEAFHRNFAGLADDGSSSVYVAAGEEKQLDLTLVEGCIIEGEVVDSQGALVGEGAIEIWTGMGFPRDYRPAGSFARGRFRYQHIDRGLVRIKVWPWKSTHSEPQDFECLDGARFNDVVFVIPAAPPDLEGVVVNTDGEPVPGAFLDLLPLGHNGLAQQERADDSGTFAFFSHPPGRYVLSAFVPGEGVAAREVAVPAQGVRLELGGTGGIEGTASGLDSGSFTFTIERCYDGSGNKRWSVVGMRTTSAPARLVHVNDGRFYIDELPACTLQATARTAHREQRISVAIRADEDVELRLDLAQPVIATVRGTVYDGEGNPAPFTDVRREFSFLRGVRRDPPRSTETDGAGRFEIQAFAGDRLVFYGPRGQAQVLVTELTVEREHLDVTLTPLPPFSHHGAFHEHIVGALEGLDDLPLHQ